MSGSGKSSVVCGVTEKIRHHMQEEESQSTRLTLLTDRKHMYGEKTKRNTRHESVLSLHASSVVSSLPKRHEDVEAGKKSSFSSKTAKPCNIIRLLIQTHWCVKSTIVVF